MAIKHTTVSKTYPHFTSLVYPLVTPAAVTVTTGTTPVTGTAAQVLGGLIICDCQDTGTLTMPTAALLQAAMEPGFQVGSSFVFTVRNSGDTVLTIAAGTGGTASGTMTIAALSSKSFLVRVTAIGSGLETYTVYTLGSAGA